MNIKRLKNDEEGFVLIVALLIMLLLTILGIASITTSSIEVQIADNIKRHMQHFSQAEAANMRVLQMMRNEVTNDPGSLKTSAQPWLSNGMLAGNTLAEARDPVWWDKAGAKVMQLDTTDPNNRARFAALNMGLAPGFSVGTVANQRPYLFVCMGLYLEDTGPERGMVLVETGFVGNM